MKRLLRRIGVVLVVMVTAMSVGAQPARAYPYWQPFFYDLSFHCTDEYYADLVHVHVCIVVNGQATQAVAAIGYSASSGSIQIAANPVQLYHAGNLIYNRTCNGSNLNHGPVVGCYATTIQRPCGTYVQAWGKVFKGDIWVTVRSPSWQLCT